MGGETGSLEIEAHLMTQAENGDRYFILVRFIENRKRVVISNKAGHC